MRAHAGSRAQVAEEILRRLGPWPPASTVTETAGTRPPAVIDDCSAILVTGPRAVGTSTAAWQVLMESVDSGHCTAYLDLEQLGFLPTAFPEAVLVTKLANVATCWAGVRKQGAERLVLSGHRHGHDLRFVRDLLPSICIVALTATPDVLLPRAERRRRHKDWLPGDDLYGCDDAYLREIALEAATFEPEHADVVLNTDGLTPTELATRIAPCWAGATIG